jgi:hypothetical protein
MRELREFEYFKAWLLFFFIATVGGAVVGLIFGSLLAVFMGAAGSTTQEILSANRILGFVVALPISYVTFRAVVGKFLFPKLWDAYKAPRERQQREERSVRSKHLTFKIRKNLSNKSDTGAV